MSARRRIDPVRRYVTHRRPQDWPAAVAYVATQQRHIDAQRVSQACAETITQGQVCHG